jgi:hypothetical protein
MNTATDSTSETVTLTLHRKTYEGLVWGLVAAVARSNGGARNTYERLLRELESGKPLSQEMIADLIGHAFSWGRVDTARELAKAFRPEGKLTNEEELNLECRKIERNWTEARQSFSERIADIKRTA